MDTDYLTAWKAFFLFSVFKQKQKDPKGCILVFSLKKKSRRFFSDIFTVFVGGWVGVGREGDESIAGSRMTHTSALGFRPLTCDGMVSNQH